MKGLYRQLGIKGSWLFWACCLILLACNQAKQPPLSIGQAGIEETVSKGGSEVLLHLSQREMSVADHLTLTLTVTTDENHLIDWPQISDKLDQFTVANTDIGSPELIGTHRKKVTRSWRLEPFLSGDYKVPPLTVLIRKNRAAKQPAVRVQTQSHTIAVKSLLPTDKADLKPNDIKPPTEIPFPTLLWACSGAGGIVLLLLLGLWLYFRRRGQNGQPGVEKPLEPHVVAYQALDNLTLPDLYDPEAVKRFYLGISTILRNYIEKRFGINAAEQTTEEFLGGLKHQREIPFDQQPLLKHFLAQCDLVKFARHQPEQKDMEAIHTTCRRFVDQTRVRETETGNL